MPPPATEVARLKLNTARGVLPVTLAHRPRITQFAHLELDAEGQLRIVAPRRMSVGQVQNLLVNNVDWVERFLDKALPRHPRPLRYAEGGRHLYRGQRFPLMIRRGERPEVRLHGGYLRVYTPDREPEVIRDALRVFYRQQAEQVFQRRFERLAGQAWWLENRHLQLDLRRMSSTWGTCRRTGVIRINTHLIKAPPVCLDYVIAHELCHVRHMHHGATFYGLLSEFFPSWERVVQHLADHGHRYTQD